MNIALMFTDQNLTYPKHFNVRSIPRTFLIDKKGNIVIDKTGASNWNSKKVRAIIDQLLTE